MTAPTDDSPLIRLLKDEIVERAIEYKNQVQHGQFGHVDQAKKALWDVIDDYETETAT